MKLLLIPSLAALYGYQEDVFRVETRVVNIETIVRDAETKLPVEDLAAAQFRLRIDGKQRPITYFQRGGGERRPLAMMIYFNLAPDGALRELSRQPARESFANALARLDPKDEVAVYASRDWFVGAPEPVSALTVDRDASAGALDGALRGAQGAKEMDRRQLRKDRAQSMTLAVDEAIGLALRRPDSQTVLVFVSDGMNTLDTMETKSREALSRRLAEYGVSFSALTVDMLATYATAAAVINPMGKLFGLSVTGAGESLSRDTGGVSVEIQSNRSLEDALEKIASAYASRYSLGFHALDAEFRENRWHKLELRIEKAGSRKLLLTYQRAWKPNLKPSR